MKKNVVVFMFHKYNNNDIQCLIQLSEQSMSKSLKWKTVVHIILIFKNIIIYTTGLLHIIISVQLICLFQLLFMNLVLAQKELKMAVIKRDDILWQLFIM